MVRSQKQISFVQKKTDFLCEIGCGDGARVICLFARVIQQLGFWTQKFKPTSTTARSGAAPSALRSALDSIKHPSLRSDSSLAAKRRAEALHVFFFQRSVYSPMIGIVATKCARWVRRFPCSLGPSPRRPTASFNLAAVWCGDCVRASWLYS